MRRRKPFSIISAFLIICIFLSCIDLFSSTITIYGPKKFICNTGKPVEVTETFSAPSSAVRYNLIVFNGEEGKNRVSSATIKINGIEILGGNDLNQQVDNIERSISLQSINSISVKLRGVPLSFITVSILSEDFNHSPVASAGFDQTVSVGDTVQLDGSKSTDVDGDLLAYSWSFVSVPVESSTSLSDSTSVRPSFTMDAPGTYIVQLIVSDGLTDSLPDTVTVSTINSIPVASAGFDQTVSVGDTVQLDGSKSTDVDGDPITFWWSLITIPAGSVATLSEQLTSNPTFNVDLSGIYVAQLIINDGFVDSDPKTVTITTANSRPVANAGSDQILYAGEKVQLDGSASSDADGNPLSFFWSIISKPEGCSTDLDFPSASNPTFIPYLSGLYVVQLIVNDATEDSYPSTTAITVNLKIVTVPNVTGMTLSDAEYAITDAGLTLGIIYQENSNTVPAGNVISQIPAGGSFVPVGSSVSLVVSIGPVMVIVPNVIGMTQALAEETIKAVNLVVGIISTANSNIVPAGSVINQDPASGISVAQGSPVNLTVSLGPYVEPQPEGSFGEKYEDLIPSDATIQSYDPRRFSLITGLVRNLGGSPIDDVFITILGYPEYGTARTDAQGRFSIPVEGGGTLTVTYKKDGLITAQRNVYVPWNNIAVAETIVMISEDLVSTTLTFDGNPNSVITHQGSIVIDEWGSRSPTVVFTGDNRAYSVDVSGNVIQELITITTRATEFKTEDSMPAKLPPNSAYTYCVELSVDGAQRVRFDKPVILWVDNFLGFDVGEAVPVGYYDRDRGVWVPSDNGRVVRLLDTNSDGIVDALDASGDGQPDDLNNNSSFEDEVVGLSNPQRYFPGSTFWRVGVSHFTPWDCNWPYGPPADAAPPNPAGIPDADLQKNEEEDCRKSASIIEERSRIFHEDIPILGTDMTLHYISNRVKGYHSEITIPVSGDTVASSLKRIIVQMSIGGVFFEEVLNPLPNQKTSFTWYGLDYLGRFMNGPATAHISVGFVYDAVYLSAGNFGQAFAQAGTEVTGIRARQEVISWKRNDLHLRGRAGVIAEGWSISTHHHLNPGDPSTLHKGDGTVITNNVNIINTVAGDGTSGFSGDGGLGTDAKLWIPWGLTIDAAGDLYIADSENNRIRKLDTDGFIYTVALANLPSDVAVDAFGNLYIALYYSSIIWKLDTSGIITTAAGNGNWGYSGDGGPATEAKLSYPGGVAVDHSGNLYIADWSNSRVRKVDTNGIINTVVGNGIYGYSGDGGPAVQAKIGLPWRLAVDASGNLYISDFSYNCVRKVDANGIISTIAGNGTSGFSGDEGPAILAKLNSPGGIAVDNLGNLYIADTNNHRIRKVDGNGIITTVVGTGNAVFSGDGGITTEASLKSPGDVTIDTSGKLYIADTLNQRVRKVASPSAFASVTAAGDIAFAEKTGLGHIVDSAGRHKTTIDLNTGRILYTFGYDQDKRLVSITDQFGNTTVIQRNGDGVPIGILSPDGLLTTLTIDVNSHLTRITYPDSSSYNFEYTPDGLMTAKIEPEGNRFEHIFNSSGRLTSVSDQEEGLWQYSKTPYSNGDIRTEVLSAEGNLTSYLDRTDLTGEYTSRITDPSGAETIYTRSADGLTANKSLPCGVTLNFKFGIDSQYKFQVVKEMREKTISGLEKITLLEKIYQDTNADKIPDLITEKMTLNGKLTSFITDTLQFKRTMTSPMGRVTSNFYDPNTLRTTRLTTPGLYDTTFEYDTRGRLTLMNTNIRQTAFAYDTQGNLYSTKDPENHTTTYTYDQVKRLTGILRPDGTDLGFMYDQNGNMTVLTNPSKINHGFGYNRINFNSSYETPLSGSYSYFYNRDRQLTKINFPSAKQIKYIYDKERLIQTQTPEGNIDLTYFCGSKLDSITRAGEVITYGYDGSLVTSESLKGALNQVLTYTYNNDFNIITFNYAGGTVNYDYDNDGLLTGSGYFTITRNAANGLPETITGGPLNLTRTFNGYAEVESQEFIVNDMNLNAWELIRDKNGRINTKTETVEGGTSNYLYTYDSMSRLRTVTLDGNLIEEYQYDSVGRRIYEMNVLRGIYGRIFTYSDEDHLLTAGEVTYQYDMDGFLISITQGSKITGFNYSSRGELLSIILPDGRVIEYINDPLGRKIAKKVDGVITEKYLWQGLTRLLAVYDGINNLVMRFEYADARMPVAMTRDGTTYYLSYDQVGSLRVVVDTSGNLVKRIDYDAFGSIINDTNVMFTVPFGFAGGLYDRDTGFVRFGLRDYDPDIGRWTAKDPILFAGRDVDLYEYVANNPVNVIDSLGLLAAPWHFGITSVAAMNSGKSFSESLSLARDTTAVDFASGSQGQNPEAVVQHAMGTPVQSSEQAIAAANAYIQSNITSGNLPSAIHAAQDLATPGHAGQPWSGFGLDLETAIHILGDIFPSLTTVKKSYQNTKGIFNPCLK